MTVLIDGATEDASSDSVDATGPIVVAVVGTLVDGSVRITADLGSGEATVYRHSAGDPTSVARLELASGIAFKAYLEGTSSAFTEVTVEYVNV